MDVIFDWNLGNMIYNGLITLRRCGFPFAEIGVASDSKGSVACRSKPADSDATLESAFFR